MSDEPTQEGNTPHSDETEDKLRALRAEMEARFQRMDAELARLRERVRTLEQSRLQPPAGQVMTLQPVGYLDFAATRVRQAAVQVRHVQAWLGLRGRLLSLCGRFARAWRAFTSPPPVHEGRGI